MGGNAHCVRFGGVKAVFFLEALFVDMQCLMNISLRMGIFVEQDGCILGPPFWPSILSIECIKCTLPAIATTPLQWT